MNIVHVIVGLHTGGAELMLKRLVLYGHNIHDDIHSVISLTELGNVGAELRKQGVSVHVLGMKNLFSIPNTILKLRAILKELRPDAVQTWMYHADFLGGLAAKSLGINNIIWGVRTTDVSQGASKSTIYLSKTCARLSYWIPNSIVCAGHNAMQYHQNIGYDKGKTTVIPNGYDIKKLLASSKDGADIRNQFHLKPSDIVIGSVGRFNLVKNQQLFVEMAAILVKKNPNIKFMMVGRENTSDNSELMSWITNLNLLDNFRLLGQRSDIPKCLKAMDIFCLHSKTEGFPNVLVEAMAVGLPCVSTNVGDAKFILNKFGKVVPSDEVEKLAKGVEEIIAETLCNKDKLKYLSAAMPQYINNNFGLKSVYEKYSNVWRISMSKPK